MKYLVKAAYGRTVGAIGIFHPVEVTVEADNPEAALIKAYDTIEHLQDVTITPVTTDEVTTVQRG